MKGEIDRATWEWLAQEKGSSLTMDQEAEHVTSDVDSPNRVKPTRRANCEENSESEAV